MRASIDKINQLLNSKKTITITTHTNPDGDAIGSSFALYHYLLKLNHNVKVITPNKHPDFLDWIPGIDNLEIFDDNPEKCNKILDTSDLVFTLDFNDLKNKTSIITKDQGVIYTGNPKILKKICPGVYGTIKPVGYCMIGKR